MPSQTRDSAPVTIGVDVGGTKTHAAAYTDDLFEVAHLRTPTTVGSNAAVAASVHQTLRSLVEQLGGRTIGRIGIGIPGLIDPNAGNVRHAVNLGIGEDPLQIVGVLSAAYQVPCVVENDVNVAALGAFHLLSHNNDVSDLAYLSIGTGIAAGIVLNGQLHRGHRGVAGEIGHFPMVTEGPVCECGLRGCLESVASGTAIAKAWPNTSVINPVADLFSQATAQNHDAVRVVNTVADHLAKAIHLLAISYDVDRIVIGGGVSNIGTPLLEAIQDAIGRLETQSAFVRSLELSARVNLKPPHAIGSIGAAMLALTASP